MEENKKTEELEALRNILDPYSMFSQPTKNKTEALLEAHETLLMQHVKEIKELKEDIETLKSALRHIRSFIE